MRAILLPLALYCVSAVAVGYFLHSAEIGHRGLHAKQALKLQIFALAQELDEARAEHAEWDRRLKLLRSDEVDRDLLDERARSVLGRVHRNDVVIVMPAASER